MSYDEPLVEQYVIPSAAFGLTTDSISLKGPKGKRGYVRDILVPLTVAAAGTTTVPEIVVGTALGLSEYARFRLGTTAVLGYGIGIWRASIVAGDNQYGASLLEDYPGHVKMTAAYTPAIYIPADATFFISRVQGAGGTGAGTGATYVWVDWT